MNYFWYFQSSWAATLRELTVISVFSVLILFKMNVCPSWTTIVLSELTFIVKTEDRGHIFPHLYNSYYRSSHSKWFIYEIESFEFKSYFLSFIKEYILTIKSENKEKFCIHTWKTHNNNAKDNCFLWVSAWCCFRALHTIYTYKSKWPCIVCIIQFLFLLPPSFSFCLDKILLCIPNGLELVIKIR